MEIEDLQVPTPVAQRHCWTKPAAAPGVTINVGRVAKLGTPKSKSESLEALVPSTRFSPLSLPVFIHGGLFPIRRVTRLEWIRQVNLLEYSQRAFDPVAKRNRS
jgi:hypothetical protein